MCTRLSVVFGLALLALVVSGCSYVGTYECGNSTARSPCQAWTDFQSGLGLVNDPACSPCCGPSPLGREYGRTANRSRDFFSTYLFNYDPYDPYRGNDARELGEVIGQYGLMYPHCDPYRGDCPPCTELDPCDYPQQGCSESSCGVPVSCAL